MLNQSVFIYTLLFCKADEVKLALRKYIYFYNQQRFQKKLNNLSPYKYRTQVV
ncbi:IS3 family transposase [Bacillus sp. NPDC060175]|uniref:IS3 family transposase n=1 Tax=Bacillus sp. NPDC060175 TaxID=3347061 RepID=UPI00364D246B